MEIHNVCNIKNFGKLKSISLAIVTYGKENDIVSIEKINFISNLCWIYDLTNAQGTQNITRAVNHNDYYRISYQNHKLYQNNFDEKNVTLDSLVFLWAWEHNHVQGARICYPYNPWQHHMYLFSIFPQSKWSNKDKTFFSTGFDDLYGIFTTEVLIFIICFHGFAKEQHSTVILTCFIVLVS